MSEARVSNGIISFDGRVVEAFGFKRAESMRVHVGHITGVAVQSNYGRGRRMYEGAGERMGMDAVYVEVSPGAARAQPSEGAT